MTSKDPRKWGYDCAVQDACENAPFACIGGLAKRQKPLQAPSWIPESEAEEWLEGYREAALKMYGDDWRTCEFRWKPVLSIGGDQ